MSASTWPEWVKLVIFKAFVRPLYEYGAPALFHWCQTTRESLASVEALQTRALNWVVGIAHRDSIVRCLTGVTTVSIRFKVLAVKFLDHLKKMHPEHPAHLLCSHFQTYRPWPMSSILPRCRLPALVESLPHISTQGLDPRQILSLRLRELNLSSLENGKMASMILRCARQTAHHREHPPVNPHMDSCLWIKDDIVRRKAIAWRCNTYGVRRKCLCGHPFRRTHVDGCIDVHFPATVDDYLGMRDQDIGENESLVHTSYNIVDCLLNHSLYDIFAEVMGVVDKCLVVSDLPLDLADHEEHIPDSPVGSLGYDIRE